MFSTDSGTEHQYLPLCIIKGNENSSTWERPLENNQCKYRSLSTTHGELSKFFTKSHFLEKMKNDA